jgi:hypothetical protein
MNMNQSPIATAADYADAMLIARRVKGFLTLLVLVMLALQIALFFMVRSDVIRLKPEAAASTQSTTGPELILVTGNDPSPRVVLMIQYLTGLIDFLGMVCVLLVSAMLLLLVLIMLVGRLIGLSQVMAGLIGSLVAAVLLFPWQAFLDNAGLTVAAADFKIPGVLYTWRELSEHAHFPTDVYNAVLGWARFVGFPVVAFGLLVWVHVKSSRGLRLALGEDEPPMDETSGRQG